MSTFAKEKRYREILKLYLTKIHYKISWFPIQNDLCRPKYKDLKVVDDETRVFHIDFVKARKNRVFH